jgi:AraC-like DNA-binding protein
MELRPELRRIVDQLLSRPTLALSLDEIAEAIGATELSSAEIEAIFIELESAERRVLEAPVSAKESLRRVLRSARSLREELRRAPTASEIAEHAGLSASSVRLALLFAKTLAR